MIIKSPVTTNLKIEKLEDLYKLKPFMESANLKINKSQIARELDVDSLMTRLSRGVTDPTGNIFCFLKFLLDFSGVKTPPFRRSGNRESG